jgi:hypothetical protein
MKCESCGFFGEYYKFQHKDALVGPLGSSDASILLKPGRFDVIRTRITVPNKGPRSTTQDRSYNRNQQFTPTEDPIPKYPNGLVDSELESMLKNRPGIITALVDSTEQELE